MGKCFVTQLAGTVQQQYPIFDGLLLAIKGSTTKKIEYFFKGGGPCIKMSDSITFQNYGQTQEYSELTQDMNYYTIINSSTEPQNILIKNKSDIVSLRLQNLMQVQPLNIKNIIRYCTSLTELYAYSPVVDNDLNVTFSQLPINITKLTISGLVGYKQPITLDISSLKNATQLTTLNISDHVRVYTDTSIYTKLNLIGDCTELGSLINLTEISFEGVKMTGTIQGLLNAMVQNGRTSGNLSVSLATNNSSIKYNGQWGTFNFQFTSEGWQEVV